MAKKTKSDRLLEFIGSVALADYPHHSRCHPLNSFPDDWYVKREDELSFGVSGSKMRKYRSLLPDLHSQGIREAVLIGGASSNNLVGLSQLLIEQQIRPILFLCGNKPPNPSGNLLISQLLVPSNDIYWHERSAWPEIEQRAAEYALKRSDEGIRCHVISEGASCTSALPGALTLGLDIAYNEQQLGSTFDHIICDAGTGMMAAALILCNSMLGRTIHHHVILTAEDHNAFRKVVDRWRAELEMMIGEQIDELAPYECYKPKNAASFGSINSGVLDEIRRVARDEGIITDPVYSAKLFAEGRRLGRENNLNGKVLLVHSGGALGFTSRHDQITASVDRSGDVSSTGG